MKNIIHKSLAALLLVPAFALMLSVATPIATPANAEFNRSATEGANAAKGKDTQGSLFGDGSEDGIFKTISNVLLFIIGAISVIMLIIGGIRYTISGGDQTQVTAAKNTILYAVIGIVVALLAFALVNFVLTSFTEK